MPRNQARLESFGSLGKTYDGTNVRRFINGTLESTYPPASAYVVQPGYVIGSWFNNATSGSPLYVGEVVVVTGGAVSDAQAAAFTAYARNRWGF